jgi:hypothetical protein
MRSVERLPRAQHVVSDLGRSSVAVGAVRSREVYFKKV